MKMYGIELSESSKIKNNVVESGSSSPSQPDLGELFYSTTNPVGLYFYDGSAWVKVRSTPSVTVLGAGDRSFNTAFQVNASLSTFVCYTVSLEATNNSITVDLQTATSSTGPWTTVASARNSSTFSGIGLGSITSIIDSTISAFIPAGYYVKLTTTGSGNRTFRLGHEVVG